MANNLVYCLLIFLIAYSADAASCRDGWVTYKDELCLKTFSNLVTYQEAKSFCSSQGDETVSLVMIKDEELQLAVANYTKDIFNSLWLGGKYDRESDQFRWEDGDPLTYTNWLEDHPRNNTEIDACIELRTPNSKFGVNQEGKWADVNCLKLNMVMCQSPVSWTFDDAVSEIIKMRKQLEATTAQLESTAGQLEATQQNLQVVESRVVPVGSIYIEYFNQPSPPTLWPSLSWQDISSSYAGLFFRVSGGGSEGWGTTQGDCAPHISRMEYGESSMDIPSSTEIPGSGWSEWNKIGAMFRSGSVMFEMFRLHSAHCEVRPKNQAVRIWKRTA